MKAQSNQVSVAQIPEELVRYNALMARALKQLKELEAQRRWYVDLDDADDEPISWRADTPLHVG